MKTTEKDIKGERCEHRKLIKGACEDRYICYVCGTVQELYKKDSNEISQLRADDSQVGGDHYKKFKITPWMIIEEHKLDFFEGSALKYLLRKKNNRLEDLKKLEHYVQKLIEREEHNVTKNV